MSTDILFGPPVKCVGTGFTIEDRWTVDAGCAGLSTSANVVAFLSAAEAARLLELLPVPAEKRAREALENNSADPQALRVLAAVLCRAGREREARPILERLVHSQPQMEFPWRGLGLILAKSGERVAAVRALLRAVDLEIRNNEAWRALGGLLDIPAGPVGSSRPGADLQAAAMLVAEGEFRRALPLFDDLAVSDAGNVLIHRRLKAETLALLGQYESAAAEFASLVAVAPPHPGLWYQYGRTLRLLRNSGAAAAFERAIEILPCYFEAWFALATLKSFHWNESLIARIRAQLARTDLSVDDRALLHFVLARALESTGRFEEAFANYTSGNKIRKQFAEWNAEPPTAALIETRFLFGAQFLRSRSGAGLRSRAPIFIVGLPRAGSTLVEQILSSHSAIEGLGERPDLWAVAGNRLEKLGRQNENWPAAMRHFGPADLRAMGEEYLFRMSTLRTTQKPFFTDKQPSNYQLTGLIHLILPDAKIIDVRRHPVDCGLSCYRHYFPAGQPYTCDLEEFAHRYTAYVELMAHFDSVLPGKVYRVIYEKLVADFEPEVRRLLTFLGVPFEEQCLRFHENSRTVQTLSFEQVAMPLYRTGAGQSDRYERWLAPLKTGLGYLLETYPDVPQFFPRLRGRLRKPLHLGEAGDRFTLVRGLQQVSFGNDAIATARRA